ncbi:hypothetical protein C8F04DRAFT_1182993 [Mycena alexandri]|uniref:Uncharacterized protein n=1 Tax=Mycena alexandri TaxID=1745969 RepID=A0AAD6SVR2_9AGAR|nr:hypothetical protein C8F04DRAFT_1182980 [Mycena alexandri]KAJ7034723.1 hypothetical protein C8F04DRAFT_1182984 [Mycena alexandri]KAJ7034734.1 hypothetical protein C8F04DRAFT_1182993 [Mycena alexandri]
MVVVDVNQMSWELVPNSAERHQPTVKVGFEGEETAAGEMCYRFRVEGGSTRKWEKRRLTEELRSKYARRNKITAQDTEALNVPKDPCTEDDRLRTSKWVSPPLPGETPQTRYMCLRDSRCWDPHRAPGGRVWGAHALVTCSKIEPGRVSGQNRG